MEKSTPKPREKKPTKIDVAIARITDEIDELELSCKRLVLTINNLKDQRKSLIDIKNDTTLI